MTAKTTTRQNTSHAVMAQRAEPKDSLDYFPTPPWGTRALMEHVLKAGASWKSLSCLEPACGEGHMARALSEYFKTVYAADIFDYGGNTVDDFLSQGYYTGVDWTITNPPFRLAEQFIHKALEDAKVGVAMLCRSQFDEGKGRYERLFRDNPPTVEAVFVERLPMVRGRLDRKASTATSYSWFVWRKGLGRECQKIWIPPCRKQLERDSDYAQ